MFGKLGTAVRLTGAIVRSAGERHIALIAAGVGFYGLMALFPAITALVTLWGFFANPDIVGEQVELLKPMVPEEAFSMVEGQIHAIASGPKQVLGWASGLSILTAIWATRAGVGAMIGGLNAVYDTTARGGLRHLAFALFLTGILVAVALVALLAVVIAPVVLSFLPLGPFTGVALDLLRWLIAIGVVLLGIGVLYRLGPNRPGTHSPLLSPGSILAAVLWALVSWGFSTYLTRFGSYNEVYGSLGAVVALLMWLYLSAFVVLLGGLLNAELERLATTEATRPHGTDRDTDPDEAHGAREPSSPQPATVPPTTRSEST